MVGSVLADVASKVNTVRNASVDDPVALSRFPPGRELDTMQIIDAYREEMRRSVDGGDAPASTLAVLEGLRMPTSLIEFYRITSGPTVSGLKYR